MVEIIWSRRAIFDLLEIAEYIKRDSVTAAANLVVGIDASVERLQRFPGMGRMVPEDKLKAHREVIVKKYRVIYRIKGKTCYIVDVVDSRRDLKKMIDELGIFK